MTCGLRPVEVSLPCGYVKGAHGALVPGVPGLKSETPTARRGRLGHPSRFSCDFG
jgi:hypothetical protein